jgi:hypothetical protein
MGVYSRKVRKQQDMIGFIQFYGLFPLYCENLAM